MKIHDLIQGSPQWLAYRAQMRNASDAPAMMGCSAYKTRADLLREMHTGLAAEVDIGTQMRFDNGHRAEALARPLAEEFIGDQLYPVTGSLGNLSASFDGITLDEETTFEHKALNDELRSSFHAAWTDRAEDPQAGRYMPLMHRVQMEQQLLVSGAKRVLFMASAWTPDDELIEERRCWYYPDEKLRCAITDGWYQFDLDLAAYTLPAATEPAPVGKAPNTLPALRIEVTGMVTASNLAEFKETALAAIRSVNRDLSTDADFADAEKAVKWCADVESRLAGAKEHALSQTSSIDQLFKAIDDISAEARRVRLDLDKLVVRRKMEVKEEAVTAARSALDLHIAAVNSEIAPMRLLPLAVDFAGAIRGKRSIDSMRDALDTALAGAKIAADAQGRAIRTNITLFMDDAHGLEFLFADLGQIVHKAPDDFATLVHARVDTHQAAEAERARKAAEAEAQRIAAAEQRAREQEAARSAEAQRQQEAAVEAQRQAAAALATAAADPAQQATAAAPPPVSPVVLSMPAPTVRASAPASHEPATLNLGAINVRFGGCVKFDAAGLALMGIEHSATDKSARLYRESDIGRICRALVALAVEVQEAQAVAE